jgi:hypothetical protein
MPTIVSTITFILLLLASIGFVFFPDATHDLIDSVISPNKVRYVDLERLERDGDRVLGWRRERVATTVAECKRQASALKEALAPDTMVRCVAYTKDLRQLRIVPVE